MVNKTEYIARSLTKGTHKSYETFVINAIYTKINNPQLEIVTQQHIFTDDGVKYIDLYFPQLKIAVEVDEGYHDNEEQIVRDLKREETIKKSIQNNIIAGTNENQIKILRIQVATSNQTVDFEKLMKSIDTVVETIKKAIDNLGAPLVWYFDSEERLLFYKKEAI